MSGPDLSLELPEGTTPGELMKGYFSLMRLFGWDLYITSHFALKESLGQHWFPARISDLQESDPTNWRPNFRFDRQDPGVILRDYVFEDDSPYRRVFGDEFRKRGEARKILSTRNTWFHFGEDPTIGQLSETAKTIRGFVLSSGMAMGNGVDRLIRRIDELATGRYRPADPVDSPTTPPEPPRPPSIPTPDDLPRPNIGGTWVGPIPDGRFRLTRTADVIDPESMASVRDRVVGDYAEKVRAWTAIEPRGRELWIADDGAVGGFIGASPRLLGYLGADPEDQIARGFFVPHHYLVDAGDVVDIDTQKRITAPFDTAGRESASIRVTTYGDVIDVGAAESVERLAIVRPADWFPGHL